jgi:deoxyinosine 3'endonuclease (endonuclease V)
MDIETKDIYVYYSGIKRGIYSKKDKSIKGDYARFDSIINSYKFCITNKIPIKGEYDIFKTYIKYPLKLQKNSFIEEENKEKLRNVAFYEYISDLIKLKNTQESQLISHLSKSKKDSILSFTHFNMKILFYSEFKINKKKKKSEIFGRIKSCTKLNFMEICTIFNEEKKNIDLIILKIIQENDLLRHRNREIYFEFHDTINFIDELIIRNSSNKITKKYKRILSLINNNLSPFDYDILIEKRRFASVPKAKKFHLLDNLNKDLFDDENINHNIKKNKKYIFTQKKFTEDKKDSPNNFDTNNFTISFPRNEKKKDHNNRNNNNNSNNNTNNNNTNTLDKKNFDQFNKDKYKIDQWENMLKSKLKLNEDIDINSIKYIAGVDTQYLAKNSLKGISGLIVINYENNDIVYKDFLLEEFKYEYRASHLNIREGPTYIKMIKKLIKNNPEFSPNLIITDGTGIINRNNCGLACCVGGALDKPSFGYTKKFFRSPYFSFSTYNTFDRNAFADGFQEIKNDDHNIIGYFVKLNVNNPAIIISPGNKISPEHCLEICLRLNVNQNSPLPTFLADMCCRKLVKYRDQWISNHKNPWDINKAINLLNNWLNPKYDSIRNKTYIINQQPQSDKEIFEVQSNVEEFNDNFNSDIGNDEYNSQYENHFEIKSQGYNEVDQKIFGKSSKKKFREDIIENNNDISSNKKIINLPNKNYKEIISEDEKIKIGIKKEESDNKMDIQDNNNNIKNIIMTKGCGDIINNNPFINLKNDKTDNAMDIEKNPKFNDQYIRVIDQCNNEENNIDGQIINFSPNDNIISNAMDIEENAYNKNKEKEKNKNTDNIKNTNNNNIYKYITPIKKKIDGEDNVNIINNKEKIDRKIKRLKLVGIKKNKYKKSNSYSHSLYSLSTKVISLTEPIKKKIKSKKEKNKFNESIDINNIFYPIKYFDNNNFQKIELKPTNDFIGIRNFGNTCYFNATIQMLKKCVQFYNFIMNEKNYSKCHELLKFIFKDLDEGDVQEIHVKQLINHLGFEISQYKDTFEFYEFLLDKLKEENKNKSYRERLDQLFVIKSHDVIFCTDHKHEIKNVIQNSLRVPVKLLLTDSINYFRKNKVCDYFCDKTNQKKSELESEKFFDDLPIYLLVSLNRLKQNKKIIDICFCPDNIKIKKLNESNDTEYTLRGIIIHKFFPTDVKNNDDINDINKYSGHFTFIEKVDPNEIREGKSGIFYDDNNVYLCDFEKIKNYVIGNNYGNIQYPTSHIFLYEESSGKNANKIQFLYNAEINPMIRSLAVKKQTFQKSFDFTKINNDEDYMKILFKRAKFKEPLKIKYNTPIIYKEKNKGNETLSLYSNKEKDKIVGKCIDKETPLYDINIRYGGDRTKIISGKLSNIRDKESYFKKRVDKSNFIETKRIWNYSLSFIEDEYSNEWKEFEKNVGEMYNKAYLINFDITKNEDYKKQIGQEGFKGDSSLENIYKYAFIPFISKDEFIIYIRNHADDHNTNFKINEKDFSLVRYICPCCLQIVVYYNMISHFLNLHYFSLHLIYWTDISKHIEHYVNEQLQNKFHLCIFYIRYFASLYYFLYKYKENNLINNDSLRQKLEVMKKYINTDLIDKLANKEIKGNDAFTVIKLMESLYIDYFQKNLPAAQKNRIFREKIKNKRKKKNKNKNIKNMKLKENITDDDESDDDESDHSNSNKNKNKKIYNKRKAKRSKTTNNNKEKKIDSEADEVESSSQDENNNNEKKEKRSPQKSKSIDKNEDVNHELDKRMKKSKKLNKNKINDNTKNEDKKKRNKSFKQKKK